LPPGRRLEYLPSTYMEQTAIPGWRTRLARQYRRWAICVVGFLAATGVYAQYSDTLRFGFNYDDYHLVRPYSGAEVRSAFHGTWDSTGIERPFYRPLTVAFYAWRFDAFRYNAWKYHALSLVLFAMAGTLGAVLLMRITDSWSAPLWFVVWWCVHPNLPISLVAWATNQMHLLQTITCLTGLLWWFHVKSKPAIWWTPLLAVQVIAFLVKEDGVLLLPFICLLHGLYWLVVDRTVTRPTVGAVVTGGALIAALWFWRRQALGGLGGYRVSWDSDTLTANLAKGLTRALFLRPARTLTLQIQSWYAIGVVLAATGCAVYWRHWRTLFAISVGVGMALIFNLPFALVTKAEQYYLIATGAVFAVAASADVFSRSLGLLPRITIVALSVPVVLAMHGTARDAADLFAPANEATRATDTLANWAAVPIEIRTWIPHKLTPPHTGNLARDLPIVVFGAYDPERDRGGHVYRWTSGRVTTFVNADATSLRFSLRALFMERPRRPFNVQVLVEGQVVNHTTLTTDLPQPLVIPLRAHPGSADMTKVEVVLDHTWSPGGNDTRALGVQLSDLDIDRMSSPNIYR
jgi:hypothetical protein